LKNSHLAAVLEKPPCAA